MVKKQRFYYQLACKWNVRSNAKMVLGLGDFNEYVEKRIDRFEGMHQGNGFSERNVEGEMLLEFRGEKELCVANIWCKRDRKRKITYRSKGS